ncbi:hypothetical protein EVAR_963_1 [Eumeta japonica]|uniref:Uncharacterized protein n=1 Tax=Eumeta variegata TaxID=151549 RepID=A0A4C1SEA0_EUMVA|nr:hypothetical protein EVAR_963_1 [Eumeta japonica]
MNECFHRAGAGIEPASHTDAAPRSEWPRVVGVAGGVLKRAGGHLNQGQRTEENDRRAAEKKKRSTISAAAILPFLYDVEGLARTYRILKPQRSRADRETDPYSTDGFRFEDCLKFNRRRRRRTAVDGARYHAKSSVFMDEAS